MRINLFSAQENPKNQGLAPVPIWFQAELMHNKLMLLSNKADVMQLN